MNSNKGFSLIELMVSTVIASLMSIAVISIYASQSGSLMAESQRDISTLEANRAYDLVARLLKQGQKNGLAFGIPGTGGLSVTFDLPAGFNIWPNNVAPYDNNTVTLNWYSAADNQHLIRIDNNNLAQEITLAGDNSGSDARIINMEVWPMTDPFTRAAAITGLANSGYFVSITTRAADPDPSYTNPNDQSNFRTHTVSGVVSPRN